MHRSDVTEIINACDSGREGELIFRFVYEPVSYTHLDVYKRQMHYNPFVYIRSEKDILKLVNTLIANTKGEGEKSAEDFWGIF